MELSSRALFAQELYPLRKYLEDRFEQLGRRSLKSGAPLSRTGQTDRNRPGERPVEERNPANAFARPHRSRGQGGQKEAPKWTGSKDETVIVVLALDAYNARVYHDMLEVRGYSAVTALTVDSWLSVLGECDPDLILVDLCSSDHPSIDIARAIMRDPRYRSVPVITVTDAHKSGDLNDPSRVIVDCDGRIFKPITVDGFYRPIETVLKRAAARRAMRP